jgi:DNA repair protein RadD
MIELRQYQIDGLDALWNYYCNGGKGNILISWPTGTGKSICPAIFITHALRLYPDQRFMLLTHNSELVKQDAEALLDVWPNAPLGIYCAGLKKKDVVSSIVYGTIQSAHKLGAVNFGHRDILWIDESHLTSDDEDSMYLSFIAGLKATNPKLKVIGLSATNFRQGMGLLTEGKLWNEVVHDLTSMDNFNKLVREGYLSPLVTKKTQVELDVSNVSVQKGEFVSKQLQHEVDKAEITLKALQEACYYGNGRRSWLIFATGIDHANHIAEILMSLGVDCASVHSKQPAEYNKKAIDAFKNYELKAIANYGKLTTGFNHPGIDFIIMLRPTLSVALWVQMLGRATRPAEGKQNALVLDFAKNTARLGPINDPCIPRKKGDKGGELPIKICDACGVYNHIKAIKCDSCGKPFEFKVKIVARAGTEEVLRQTEAPIIETFDINYVTYSKKQKVDKHTGKAKPSYIQANYFSGINLFKEFIFPENKGFRKPFVDWWRQRSVIEPPATTEECVNHISQLRAPRRIRVHVNRMLNGRNYPEVLSAEW